MSISAASANSSLFGLERDIPGTFLFLDDVKPSVPLSMNVGQQRIVWKQLVKDIGLKGGIVGILR